MKSTRAKVFFKDDFAGTLEKNEDSYTFTYDSEYLKNPDAVPISINFPLTNEPYQSEELFPFFEGLIPEGWLLELNARALKISSGNDFGMLVNTCKDCIGAVRVELVEE